MRQVLIYPGEDGYWIAEVPSLPGCIAQGKTRDEALDNIAEAITLYLDALHDLSTKHSILELAGLGAEIWEGIDAQEYVNQLRSEWEHRP